MKYSTLTKEPDSNLSSWTIYNDKEDRACLISAGSPGVLNGRQINEGEIMESVRSGYFISRHSPAITAGNHSGMIIKDDAEKSKALNEWLSKITPLTVEGDRQPIKDLPSRDFLDEVLKSLNNQRGRYFDIYKNSKIENIIKVFTEKKLITKSSQDINIIKHTLCGNSSNTNSIFGVPLINGTSTLSIDLTNQEFIIGDEYKEDLPRLSIDLGWIKVPPGSTIVLRRLDSEAEKDVIETKIRYFVGLVFDEREDRYKIRTKYWNTFENKFMSGDKDHPIENLAGIVIEAIPRTALFKNISGIDDIFYKYSNQFMGLS